MADNTSYLSPEIIENILSRLPAKSLLRFKSVSKSWNTMIADPVFVQNHIRQSKHSNSDNLFLYQDAAFCSCTIYKLGDQKIQTSQEIESPYISWYELCFCDGVILLTDGTYRRFVLWNPSTRTSRKLWHKYRCRYAAFGLCRDPTTDDFKVVIVDKDYYSVYSCRNKSWIACRNEYKIEHTGLSMCAGCNIGGVSVDGATYWVFRCRNSIRIVYYDPRDDKFEFLQKPEDDVVNDNRWFYVVELRGRLCLYYNSIDDESTIQIWTKEKGIDGNSWNKLMTVENHVEMSIWEFHPLCFVGNKIVILNRDLRTLLVYDPCKKRLEDFEEDTAEMFGFVSVSVPIPYVDSLFFHTETPRPKAKGKLKRLR
ncbi:hypothetical protein MIMGU_mgv1a022892mg [Erythranthe guttata]|uniref:F-box domain-containing protein n=1 Tax=Erythranthe guttata TaxID=4155 RepID=A0A022RNT6_ERYGU|nr:PREDICTED: putative F-box protein At3g17480 [Erythranthe guttata]EYU40595.1 hypothetical protein MIMGU_mgv1a022892mg [Erythranthe guttata]|eukprot:XP_012833501.1 PREDICTED: putative F-box protein At3g17480 [Erythranthe guttata]